MREGMWIGPNDEEPDDREWLNPDWQEDETVEETSDAQVEEDLICGGIVDPDMGMDALQRAVRAMPYWDNPPLTPEEQKLREDALGFFSTTELFAEIVRRQTNLVAAIEDGSKGVRSIVTVDPFRAVGMATWLSGRCYDALKNVKVDAR